MAVHEQHAAPRTVTPEQLAPPWVVDHLRKRWMGIAGFLFTLVWLGLVGSQFSK